MANCLNCNKITTNPKFCSTSCSAKLNNKLNPKRKKTSWSKGICKECQKEITFKTKSSKGHYCSNLCQQAFLKNKIIKEWTNGINTGCLKSGRLSNTIRSFLLKNANYKCSKCGWNSINPTTGKCPLEIDHIDGNSENCKPENLRVLCPNCHSLTETWKALNKGNGNHKRLKYGKLIS
jgi:hypothetical protein